MNNTRQLFSRSLFSLAIVATLSFNILRGQETASSSLENNKTITISVDDRNLEKEVTLCPGQELTINIAPAQSRWNSFWYPDYSNFSMNSNYDLDEPHDYQISYHLLENIDNKYRDSWLSYCNLEEERNLNTNRPEMSYHFKARESSLISEELPKKFRIELFSIWHGYEMNSHQVNFLNMNVTIQ